MTKTLLAVDGNSLVHRNYHALLASQLRTRAGRPTWAIKGALSQILGAVAKTNADAVVIGFDDAGNNARKKVYPEYKATRSEKDADLVSQLSLAIQVFRRAGLHVVVSEGLEADDILASAAAAATEARWRTVVCTSDRDAFALITDTVSVLRILNGGVGVSPILTPKMLANPTLVGVHPWQYRQYAAMRGDTSDNLPGIKFVGEKTAKAILATFGSVEAAFADVDTNGGQRVAAEVGKAVVKHLSNPEGREAFWRNIELMTMRTDVPLGMDLTAPSGASLLPLDPAALHSALEDAEFHSLQRQAREMLAWTGDVPGEHPSPHGAPPVPSAVPVSTEDQPPLLVAAGTAPHPAAAEAVDEDLRLF